MSTIARIRRMLIIILIAMVLISFVAVITLNFRLNECEATIDIFTEYIKNGGAK